MIIFNIISYLLALVLTLFVPGLFLLRFLGQQRLLKPFSIEGFVLSVAGSLFITDFLMIILGLLSIDINRFSLIISSLLLLAIFEGRYYLRKKNNKTAESIMVDTPKWEANLRPALAAIFFLALLLRLFYILPGAVPQTTDLGHHMYWAKVIQETGQLPDYGMPDFIIGEHLVFSAITILSGIDLISSLPLATLFFINMVSLLAMLLLSFRLTQLLGAKNQAGMVSTLTLLAIGVFYAISSPQAKFVSGGVIGNVTGNFLMPMAFYCLFTAFNSIKEKNLSSRKIYFFWFIILSATLAYTHHLTTFIFLFVLAGFFLLFPLAALLVTRFDWRYLLKTFGEWIKTFLSWQNIILIILFLIFALWVFPPSYLNSSAIDTAVGTPTKETRTGITLAGLALTAGPWRFFYSLVALVIILGILVRLTIKNLPSQERSTLPFLAKLSAWSLFVSWFGMILLMSHKPAWLLVDIPTSRVASYITLPAALLSSWVIVILIRFGQKFYGKIAIASLMVVIGGTGLISGLSDLSDSARDSVDLAAIRQTHQASRYLASATYADEIILKDHIYLPADSWMKLHLMRGYKNPLSRSLLKRYDDPINDRETCTRDMVAIPDSDIGRQCFEESSVRYVVLRPNFDTQQFDESENFIPVFSGPDVVIYKRLQ